MSKTAYGWLWERFLGTPGALKWARKEIVSLDSVAKRAKHRRVAVQAGGNLGIFPKRLAQTFSTVYTFEPSAELFPLLVANAPERNIVRYQAALGDTRQLIATARVRREPDSTRPAHEGITHVSGPGSIPTLLVDDLALPVCDLLYLDLEGYEYFALRGAIDTLRRCRPVVAVEINRNIGYYGLTGDDVRAFLTAQDYVCVDNQRSDLVFVPSEWT